MMTSATKSEEKRRDWSVQRGVDHNKIRVNQAVETRNRAQFLGQVPKQQRKSYRRLARGTKHRQHARKGILLGECRFNARKSDPLCTTTACCTRTKLVSSWLSAILRIPLHSRILCSCALHKKFIAKRKSLNHRSLLQKT